MTDEKSTKDGGQSKGRVCPTCGQAADRGGEGESPIAELVRKHGEERVNQAIGLFHELTVPRPLPKNPAATLRWFLEGEGAALLGKPVDPDLPRFLFVDGFVFTPELLLSFDMDQIREVIARKKKPTAGSVETELRCDAMVDRMRARSASRESAKPVCDPKVVPSPMVDRPLRTIG